MPELKDIVHVGPTEPAGRKVGNGVYLAGETEFAGTNWWHFLIDLKDAHNGTDWRGTTVTVSMTLGGGNVGRDHWGWPGEPFAAVKHGAVSDDGIFNYWIQSGVGSSGVFAGVFRWVRREVHGVSARTWSN